MNLAQQCYASTNISDKLFDEVNKILGCDTNRCLEEGFEWAVEDVWWDEYDQSIEVVRPTTAKWMTKEEANKILDLGFYQIYESIGDEAVNHTPKHYRGGKCSPRESDEVLRLRATIEGLKNKLRIYKLLDGSEY